MMEFLRRLAPPREGDRSRAVAVLPSRFAGNAPLRLVSPPSDASSTLDDAPAPSSAHTTSPHMHTLAPERPVARAAQAATVGPAAADGTQPAASAHADAPHATPRESTPPPVRPRLRAADADAAVPARRHDRGAVAHDEQAAMPALGIAVVPAHAQARPAIGRAAVTPPVTNPLSQGAVAARAHLVETPRAVIHVTIDRIDVRTPAAPPRAARSAKRRAVAPSVSLGDYLRQRTSKPGGAA